MERGVDRMTVFYPSVTVKNSIQIKSLISRFEYKTNLLICPNIKCCILFRVVTVVLYKWYPSVAGLPNLYSVKDG